MFWDVVLLIVGMALLIKGADWFVDGASKIARAMKIPSLIIGLTLVSIGTSAPEFSVSVTAAIRGENDISFGNVIGSNIFNTFFVIGASALFTTLVVSKNMKKYDLPILIAIYLLLFLFAFAITPNIVSRWEAIIIFLLTIAYTVFLIIRSKNEEPVEEIENKTKWYMNVLFLALGLAGIIWGGDLVVDSASNIAKELGMSELLVGLTIVAVGTSLPELVTSMVAAKKGENDIAVGNAIGSCIFNVILILGVSGIILPVSVAWSSMLDVIVMLVSGVTIIVMTLKSNKIEKTKGIILILMYIAYLTYIIIRELGVL